MPGKVNPSMAEALSMICLEMSGIDHIVSQAAHLGQLELNWYTPLIMHHLTHGTEIFTNGLESFHKELIRGIQVDKKRCQELLDGSACVATALAPYLGYAETAEVVKESLKTNKPIADVVLERKLMKKKDLDKILSPIGMTKPRKI